IWFPIDGVAIGKFSRQTTGGLAPFRFYFWFQTIKAERRKPSGEVRVNRVFCEEFERHLPFHYAGLPVEKSSRQTTGGLAPFRFYFWFQTIKAERRKPSGEVRVNRVFCEEFE